MHFSFYLELEFVMPEFSSELSFSHPTGTVSSASLILINQNCVLVFAKGRQPGKDWR